MKEPATILIVDDDEAHLMIAERAIERSGAQTEVRIARDGGEALRALGLDEASEPREGRNPAAVLLDIRMSAMSGWEVLRRIRGCDRTRGIPVVVVSSSNRPDDVRRSYELGANSYLVKRFERHRPGAYLAEAARYWVDLNETPRPPSLGGSRWA